jgi:hypothetical protein
MQMLIKLPNVMSSLNKEALPIVKVKIVRKE